MLKERKNEHEKICWKLPTDATHIFNKNQYETVDYILFSSFKEKLRNNFSIEKRVYRVLLLYDNFIKWLTVH